MPLKYRVRCPICRKTEDHIEGDGFDGTTRCCLGPAVMERVERKHVTRDAKGRTRRERR